MGGDYLKGYKPEKLKQDEISKIKLNSKVKSPYLELGALEPLEGGEIESEQKQKTKKSREN